MVTQYYYLLNSVSKELSIASQQQVSNILETTTEHEMEFRKLVLMCVYVEFLVVLLSCCV